MHMRMDGDSWTCCWIFMPQQTQVQYKGIVYHSGFQPRRYNTEVQCNTLAALMYFMCTFYLLWTFTGHYWYLRRRVMWILILMWLSGCLLSQLVSVTGKGSFKSLSMYLPENRLAGISFPFKVTFCPTNISCTVTPALQYLNIQMDLLPTWIIGHNI